MVRSGCGPPLGLYAFGPRSRHPPSAPPGYQTASRRLDPAQRRWRRRLRPARRRRNDTSPSELAFGRLSLLAVHVFRRRIAYPASKLPAYERRRRRRDAGPAAAAAPPPRPASASVISPRDAQREPSGQPNPPARSSRSSPVSPGPPPRRAPPRRASRGPFGCGKRPGRRPVGRGEPDVRRPGSFRQTVQTAADQVGIHPGRRRTGPGHFVRQRLLADDHLPVRGPAAQLQEHVQIEAAAAKVAGRGRLDDRLADVHRQDSGPGTEAQEADVDRGERQGSPGAALPQAAETVGPGDRLPGRLAPVGEGSGPRLVLQPAAEGEAHDPADAQRPKLVASQGRHERLPGNGSTTPPGRLSGSSGPSGSSRRTARTPVARYDPATTAATARTQSADAIAPIAPSVAFPVANGPLNSIIIFTTQKRKKEKPFFIFH